MVRLGVAYLVTNRFNGVHGQDWKVYSVKKLTKMHDAFCATLAADENGFGSYNAILDFCGLTVTNDLVRKRHLAAPNIPVPTAQFYASTSSIRKRSPSDSLPSSSSNRIRR